ncbi:flagellar biosynthesis protein FliO [Pseudorhodoplanes sp.]|uniref:flagellar biosynthesis protein FliO n=1 Tax=Pseudorhodoplanes sp. TaxID=1934341 RepID=UPI00391930EF
MDSLFGEGTSLPVRFFIAFVVVFVLIGITAWLIRRFGSGALGGAAGRGRAPRLAVIEAGAVDGRRKLVLIRRDNTEHLIMIGGPTDILIEANIVRGQAAREAAPARTAAAIESLARAVAPDETAWPLQPEPAAKPARAARPAPLDEPAQWAAAPEPVLPPAAPAPAATPAPKRSRSADALAGLAAELSVQPAAVAAPTPRPTAPVAEAPRAKPAPAPVATSAADQNLADMASRLEAALRRPGATAPAPAVAAKPAPKQPVAEAPRVAPPIAPPVAPPVAPEPTAAEPVADAAPAITIEPETPPPAATATEKAPAKSDDVFGSIEQEMANLLGRPAGKPS